MAFNSKTLAAFIKTSLTGPVQKEARWLAARVVKEFQGQALAVLYYGSCLRTGKVEGLILDFYVIVEDYNKAYGKRALAWANKILPPNVFYFEADKDKQTVRAKVAVISLDDFRKRTSAGCLNVSLWARFSQPARLILCRDKKTEDELVLAVTEAHKTMVAAALPLLEGKPSPENLWPKALSLTYGAELRSEQEGKGTKLFEANKNYCQAVTPLVLAALEGNPGQTRSQAKRAWLKRRLNGKTVSLLRLAKAAFTFSGGIDYLVWKIERSSGVKVTLKPWQRRHPFVAGALLFFQLRRRGAFR